MPHRRSFARRRARRALLPEIQALENRQMLTLGLTVLPPPHMVAGLDLGSQDLATCTFTAGSLADYTAEVDWGDGGGWTTASIRAGMAGGTGVISGDHVYSAAGAEPAQIRVTGDSDSASASDSIAVLPPAAATYVGMDTSTQGTWLSAYGGDGYDLANGAASIPSYAQVTLAGAASTTWAPSTSDPRALQDPSSPTGGRLAAAWYSATSFDIDLSDGQVHQVSMYLLDWDGGGNRREHVDVLDARTGAVLDSRDVSAFQNGVYLAWDLTGDVRIVFTNEGSSPNAVASALFFDPPGAVARADSYGVQESQTLTADAAHGVLANDGARAATTAVLVSGVAHGSLTLNNDGSFTYVPSAGYVGTDAFTYRDVTGPLAGDPVTVGINVAASRTACWKAMRTSMPTATTSSTRATCTCAGRRSRCTRRTARRCWAARRPTPPATTASTTATSAAASSPARTGLSKRRPRASSMRARRSCRTWTPAPCSRRARSKLRSVNATTRWR